MPWKPSVPGEKPTLGWYVLDWMRAYLARPALGFYEPFNPYREQEDFILRFYEINPETGRFVYDRALLGRPRGWGKSPTLAGVAIAEALADVVFDGWDADGQPVGKPWSTLKTPLVHIAAVSEEQVNNTWQPLVEMMSLGPLSDDYDFEPFDSAVILDRGKIEKRTASYRTMKGAPIVFAVMDQTEEWVPANRGPQLAQTIRTNASKNGGRTIESPNAFIPGDGSVAEQSERYAQAIALGKVRHAGLLYDHREAPATTDMSDRESLIDGLRYVYGDSSAHPGGCVLHDPPCAPGHVDLDALVIRIWDPATDEQQARSDFLNQITHASNQWISRPDWNARARTALDDPPPELRDGDTITLGFDGSKRRSRGVTDATAIVACRVEDGYVEPIRVWEQPQGPLGEDWQVPVDEVMATIDEIFRRFNVVGFYGDPAKWESPMATWEAKYGHRLKVRSRQSNPIQWWMTGGRAAEITKALQAFYSAVMDGYMSHSGDVVLTQHVLNARRVNKSTGYQIYKQNPESPFKIDAAVAAVLAWRARLDAVSAGVKNRQPTRAPRRIK